ncbi:MAG: glycosyltransferase family 2 protein [Methanocellales archaeon]|nr:glycosyltransferase family 2 protein [Methanocellales archaeon]MDD3291790.1 glycosyltransferase family 2 protein [Methanocellales archaeon]MDD5235140.1 glycosyltransferase family 2 protein [Methanocellales archaeon]MDD5485278.1 glycosyltransferase family 2 protein [Methanocellales archaeon]
MQLNIIVPVSLHEPLYVIKKSLESLSRLDRDSIEVCITYVIDSLGDDHRVRYLQDQSVDVIARKPRGRKAGAINDVLDIITADYIAFFDVDSRPDKNFLVECVRALEKECAVIASAPRYVTNPDASIISRVVSAEYILIADLYRLLDRMDGFMQFNGLIGVLDARIFDRIRLDETAICEDADLMQQIYLEGNIAVLANTRVGEQAPMTLMNLFNQRVRWISGACEGLKYFSGFYRAKIPWSRKITWFSAMTISFFTFIASPLVPSYSMRLWRSSNGIGDFTLKLMGLVVDAWMIWLCALVALSKKLLRRQIEWKETVRYTV